MIWKGKNLRGFLHRAVDVLFDNTGTGLSATNVQDAIDEISSDLSVKSKDVTGTTSASGNISLNLTVGSAIPIVARHSSHVVTFATGSGGWYAHITNYDGSLVANAEVTVTVYYYNV